MTGIHQNAAYYAAAPVDAFLRGPDDTVYVSLATPHGYTLASNSSPHGGCSCPCCVRRPRIWPPHCPPLSSAGRATAGDMTASEGKGGPLPRSLISGHISRRPLRLAALMSGSGRKAYCPWRRSRYDTHFAHDLSPLTCVACPIATRARHLLPSRLVAR